MQKKKKGTENVLFSFPFIMKQKERTHSLSPFREEERKSSTLSFPLSWRTVKKKKKGERHLSFCILSLPQTEWRVSPSLKKEKRKRREDGRTQAEGRRTKTKMGGKTGKGREIRQRDTPQKGVFLTQESRKRTGRGIPVRKQETGLRTPFFAS